MLQVSAFFCAHGGGIEAVAGQLAARLPSAQLCVHWMAGGAPDERPLEPLPAGLTVDRAHSFDPLEKRVGLPAPLWGPGSVWRLWKEVGRSHLVHVHDYLYMPTLLAALFARWRGKPLVITQHVGEIPLASASARALLRGLNRTLGAWALRHADQAVFVGRPVQEYFERRVRLRSAALLVPNGVDHQRYRPTLRTAALAGAVELLFVGRFVEKKGTAALRTCIDLPGACWTVIGWGPSPPAHAPGPGVRLLGRLSAEAIVPHYQRADLLVLPSTGEGFPLVLQEALACGTPVLVSTEVAEAFPERDARCVFEVEMRCSDPPAALRHALAALVSDPARLARAREPALALAAQWSWPRCVQAYRSVYDRLLER